MEHLRASFLPFQTTNTSTDTESVEEAAEGKKSYQIFEDQSEAAVSVDDVMQSHDVGVFQVFQQRHYSDTNTFTAINPHTLKLS